MKGITLEQCEGMARLVQTCASDNSSAVSCCIVDDHGFEVLTVRMDGASRFSAGIARDKARTAVALGRDSSELSSITERFPDLLPTIQAQLAFRLTTLPGGLTLHLGETLIGGIGVSGASPELDVAWASRARAWLLESVT